MRNKKEIIFLIGPPGSGKSTHIKKLKKDYVLINRDDIATEIAESNNLTYRELFNRPNLVFDGETQFTPNEKDFYIENGKKYLTDFEKYGEILSTPEGYMSKISPEIFSILYKLNTEVENTLENKIDKSIRRKKDIIIDMVNNSEHNRSLILSKVSKDIYKAIAVIFNNGGEGIEDTLININKIRDLELSKMNRNKNIPEAAIISFITKYEPPTKYEGFDKIINISTKEKLEKVIKTKTKS